MGLYAAIQDPADRRQFVGGSDARTIMGNDEAALLRLWREKRGETEPEDLSGNLIVQLGVVTESLNRHWFACNNGRDALINPKKLLVAIGDNKTPRLRTETRRGYFRRGRRDFRRRRPSPPPFSSMNSIPARSKAARIASTAPAETCRRPFSKSTTVERPRPAACASCDCVISNSPRAARHWAGVI